MANNKRTTGKNRKTGTKGSFINTRYINLDANYLKENGGILNAISTASAQYIYKVIERHTSKGDRKWFNQEKLGKLKRSIVHKNSHLDEYFAELVFRAILPLHLKDLEIKEQTLISEDNDTFAKISWPNAVVFGIGSDEAGGAEALEIFDEHSSDGTRIEPSCSQLVANEFLSENIPESIQIVLNDVNLSDSRTGAHQYNLKNIISTSMHDTLLLVGHDEFNQTEITKYLTENWKRAIIDACIVAVIHAYENGIYKTDVLHPNLKKKVEITIKRSLGYFLNNSLLSNNEGFEKLKKTLLWNFKVGNHNSIDRAIWKDSDGKEIGKQILILHRICYALEKCWGGKIASFVMMHIWQCLFHQQLLFREISEEIRELPEGKLVKTKFGSVLLTKIDQPGFKPEQKVTDKRKRSFKDHCPLWIIEVNVTDPRYYNTATAVRALINQDYGNKGNQGFGLFLLNDRIINSKFINTGQTIPYEVWKKVSDAITEAEPDRWFQLKNYEGNYADFIINRTKAHQQHLPSTQIDIKFLRESICP